LKENEKATTNLLILEACKSEAIASSGYIECFEMSGVEWGVEFTGCITDCHVCVWGGFLSCRLLQGVKKLDDGEMEFF